MNKRLSDSTLLRWTAMLLVSFAMMCSYYVYDVVAPLEDLLLRELQWTGTEYGIFSGSYAWFNVFLLMLVIGGIVLDKIGIRITGTICCLLMLVGVLIKAYALSGFFTFEGQIFGYSFRMIAACIGFAIFGLGAETSYVAMNKVVVKWFTGRELALAMGIQVALARIGTACALSLSLPIAHHFQSISAPLWIGAMLILISFLAFFVYCVMDRKEDKCTGEIFPEDDPTEEFKIRDIKSVVANKGFWIIAILCLLFYSGVFPFLKYATKLMIYKYNVSSDLAGMIPSILPFGTILLTPIFGSLYDKIGKGATLMFIGSFMLMLVHTLFAIPALNEWWFATLLMIILGIAFSLVPSAMWPAVAKIIPQKKLGTAFALIFYVQNCGLMLVPMLIGWIIDRYATVSAGDTPSYNYSIPMSVFALFGASAMLFALWLKKVDAKQGYGLERPTGRTKE